MLIFHDLLVIYVSAIDHVVLLQLKLICEIPARLSDALNAKLVVAIFVPVAHALMMIDVDDGTVLSSLILFDVWLVVLQFPTVSHIFGLVIVQVAHESSVLIIHHVFCDAGHAPVSA